MQHTRFMLGGRSHPLCSSPETLLNSCPFMAAFQNIRHPKDSKANIKPLYMIQACSCCDPCKNLSILDNFSCLMF